MKLDHIGDLKISNLVCGHIRYFQKLHTDLTYITIEMRNDSVVLWLVVDGEVLCIDVLVF